jgi:hypothetical protein
MQLGYIVRGNLIGLTYLQGQPYGFSHIFGHYGGFYRSLGGFAHGKHTVIL